jgi:anti-anti-sigma factor
MKTHIKKSGNTVIVEVHGRIDYESQAPLKDSLARLVRQTQSDAVPKQIIFDLKQLEFVGSSGISTFIQALKDVNSQAAVKPLYCNVKSEFQKIIKAFDEENDFAFFESEERAKRAINQ